MTVGVKSMQDALLNVEETAKLLGTTKHFTYELMNAGLLPYLNMKSKKVRRESINEFLKKYDGWDLSDPYNPKRL